MQAREEVRAALIAAANIAIANGEFEIAGALLDQSAVLAGQS